MFNHDNQKHDHNGESERTIVAVFQSRGEARTAIAALHKAKYTHTWLGTTSYAETADGDETLTVETGGFFAGSQSLSEALVSHGVTHEAADALEGRIEGGNALLTVDPKDRAVTEAADIITEHGGRVVTGTLDEDWEPWPSSFARTAPDDFSGDVLEESVFVRR
jgi:hypothetical protein